MSAALPRDVPPVTFVQWLVGLVASTAISRSDIQTKALRSFRSLLHASPILIFVEIGPYPNASSRPTILCRFSLRTVFAQHIQHDSTIGDRYTLIDSYELSAVHPISKYTVQIIQFNRTSPQSPVTCCSSTSRVRSHPLTSLCVHPSSR